MKLFAVAAVAVVLLPGCSSADADARAAKERRQAAESAAGGEAEPHDRSAFAKDPDQVHVASPDEGDMHAEP